LRFGRRSRRQFVVQQKETTLTVPISVRCIVIRYF